MKRKAQLDVQFNWIFVLIAGAVILALFFKVANTQRQLSADKAAIRLQNDFDAITTAALQSKDTIQTVPLPKLGLNFDCADCSCSIKFGRFSIPFNDRSIFSPYTVEGADAKLWTLDWKAPFRATNFLFITNDFVKIYLVGNDPVLDRIKAAMPADVRFEQISDVKDATNEKYSRVVFVTLGNDAPAIQTVMNSKFKDVDVHVVVVSASTNDLTFYKRNKNMIEKENAVDDSGQTIMTAFFGDEMLFGAIMAQDMEDYSCNAITAFKRLEGVGRVYQQRAVELKDTTKNPACGAEYTVITKTNDLEGGFDAANDGPLPTIIKFAHKTVVDESSPDFNILQIAADSLAASNEKLLRLSCPTVY